MEQLNKWLKAFYNDCEFKLSFRTLNKEYYRSRFEDRNMTAQPIDVPSFFYKGVDFEQLEGEFLENYVELNIENAGHRQPHDYILTSVVRIGGEVTLAFTSEYSNWGTKRLVVIDYDTSKVIRNDFTKVYNLSWEDYKSDKYQKARKTTIPVPKRRKNISNLDRSVEK